MSPTPHPSVNPATLNADDKTPWIGVHVLTEFLFCPRAGLIAYQQQHVDPGEDLTAAPRLDYLPDYEPALIEEALRLAWSRVWFGFTLAPPTLLLLAVVYFLLGVLPAVGLALFTVLPLRRLGYQIYCVVLLSHKLHLARQATAVEPDPDLQRKQPVEWWSLLRAGFTPVAYEGPHNDPQLRCGGKPWRVLQRGSLRIPVFLKRHGKPEVTLQHQARIAAYCHLIRTCEGVDVPYGIVLFADGYEGVAIPNSPENQQLYRDALVEARRFVTAMLSENLVPEAPAASACLHCPYGRPRRLRPKTSNTRLGDVEIDPKPTRGDDQQLYHSTCGDRFGGVPPHELAKSKGLL